MVRACKACVIVGVLAGLFAAAGTAHAAVDTKPVQKPFGIRIGYMLTSVNSTVFPGNNSRSFSLKPFNVGLSYDISKPKATNPAIFGVYADWFAERSNDQTFGGGDEVLKATSKVSAFGIGGNARFLFGSANAAWAPYAGVGVGGYSVRARIHTFDYDPTIPLDQQTPIELSKSKTEVGVGGKLLMGIQEKSGFLGEVEYEFLPSANVASSTAKYLNGKLSGLNLRVGYRF